MNSGMHRMSAPTKPSADAPLAAPGVKAGGELLRDGLQKSHADKP